MHSFIDREVAFAFGHSMVEGNSGKQLEKYGIDIVIRPHQICITEDMPTECPF